MEWKCNDGAKVVMFIDAYNVALETIYVEWYVCTKVGS